MTGALNYLRGAFVAYEPGGYPDRKRVIPFRFNPEGLTRTVAVEAAPAATGVEGAGPGGAAPPSAEASAEAGGAVKETFSVAIRLDLADRDRALGSLDERLGIAPEIAAIEDLLHPTQTEAEAASDGTEPVRAARPRPTVLLVWGRKRVLPVRIVSLKVDESVYNSDLNPVRAEVEASLEVLGESAARGDPAVRSALDHTEAGRRELARMYYDNTAAQGSTILPL
ncbi:hypothetical protein ACI8AC_02430 [Geodermatophilus sp. SYSU D00758]